MRPNAYPLEGAGRQPSDMRTLSDELACYTLPRRQQRVCYNATSISGSRHVREIDEPGPLHFLTLLAKMRLRMTRQIPVSDDRYQAMVEMAAAQGQTPDELLARLIDEAWEQACAAYDTAFEHDPDWQASAQEAAAQSNEPRGVVYPSTAAFFEALGASQRDIERARQAEAGDQASADAR